MTIDLISILIGLIIGIIVLIDKNFFLDIYKKQFANKRIDKNQENLKYYPLLAAVILILKGIVGIMQHL